MHFIRESEVAFTSSAKSSIPREIVLFDKGTVPTSSVAFPSSIHSTMSFTQGLVRFSAMVLASPVEQLGN